MKIWLFVSLGKAKNSIYHHEIALSIWYYLGYNNYKLSIATINAIQV